MKCEYKRDNKDLSEFPEDDNFIDSEDTDFPERTNCEPICSAIENNCSEI